MKRQHATFINTFWGCLVLTLLLKTPLIKGQTEADNTTVPETTVDALPLVSQTPILRQRPVRLPNSSFPLEYHLHIATNIHLGNLQFKGNVTIDIEIRETTDEIVLHATKLSNFVITATDLDTNDMLRDLTYTIDTRRHFLIIHALEHYQIFDVGKKYRLEILYDGVMNEDPFGLYFLAYRDAENQVM